ncbi:MAG: hypothetical protein ACRDQZ_02400 [Mycobacteriales bacterium]
MPQHDPRLFFQVAAGLIPALIFGGLISDRLKPSPSFSRSPRRFMVGTLLFVLALTVLYAEVVAINAALTAEADELSTWSVALVLVGLTATALGILVLPWLKPLLAAPSNNRLRKAITPILAVMSIALVVEAADLLVTGVQGEESLQRLDAALVTADKRDTTGQVLAAYDRMYQVRAAAGLVSKAQARNLHVCLTDRAFVEALQATIDSANPHAKALPADAAKIFAPGKPIKCHGLGAIPPDLLPGP